MTTEQINTATPQPAQQPVPPTPPVINPLMQATKMPGETFTLPSRGLFYTHGELSSDVINGEVHVYPMTTIDELVIRTPDMLYSGQAIVEVFHRCIPQILQPRELLAKDIDFLLVCLRKSSYGDTIEVTHTHECKDESLRKKIDYSIKMTPFIQNAVALDPTTIQGNFQTTLESGQVVNLNPIKYKDVIIMMQGITSNPTPEQVRQQSIDALVSLVVSVDGIVDKSQIGEWLEAIPVKWAHQISETIEAVADWGTNFDTTLTCEQCGERFTMKAPINPMTLFF